jgi:hypothetical protein
MVPRLGYLATANVPLTDEILPSGRRVPICPIDVIALPSPNAFSGKTRRRASCWSRRNGLLGRGKVRPEPENLVGQLGAAVPWPIPFLVAAIDPAAEARISHLDRAVVAGRYLRGYDKPHVREHGTSPRRLAAPMLLPTDPAIEQAAHVRVERLTGARGLLRQDSPHRLQRFLAQRPRGQVVLRHTIAAGEAYRTLRSRAGTFLDLTGYWTAGAVSYVRRGSREIAPRAVHNPSRVWERANADSGYVDVPITAPHRHRLSGAFVQAPRRPRFSSSGSQ